jgi:rubrerythrin
MEMNASRSIRSVGDFYAHALAIEREAVARYREFAEHMADHGNEAAASLFASLAEVEGEHAAALERRAAGVPVPQLQGWEYSWLDDGPPETVSHDLIFHLMTPWHALQIALSAERRAKDFFEHIRNAASDARVRDLAEEFMREEDEHIDWVNRALAQAPRPISWEEDLGRVPPS